MPTSEPQRWTLIAIEPDKVWVVRLWSVNPEALAGRWLDFNAPDASVNWHVIEGYVDTRAVGAVVGDSEFTGE